MFQVTANPEKNRLYVTLEGHLEPEERLAVGKAILTAINQLRPGFDIVNDLSKVHPTDSEGLKDLRRVQAAAKIKGVRCVLRIVKIPLSRLQIERTSQEAGLDSELVGSLEEADQRLDAMGPAPEQPS
jgi:ABC-type transporter Mla MlaB component